MLLLQSVLNGLMAGSIYILVALGLTLIMGIMGIVQFAHGEIYMFGGYLTYGFCSLLGVPFILSMVISAVLMGVIGILIEKVFYRPLRFSSDFLPPMIIAIALMLGLQNTAIIMFGMNVRVVSSPFSGVLKFAGISLSWERLMVIIIAFVLVVGLFALLRKTKIGQAMVAISQSLQGAALQGISSDRISSVGMFIGCALAAVSGSLMGAIFSLSPTMGTFALMNGIAVMILGGMGSLTGTVVGGLVIGLIEGIGGSFVGPTMSSLITFMVIILILLVRPQGIMGRRAR